MPGMNGTGPLGGGPMTGGGWGRCNPVHLAAAVPTAAGLGRRRMPGGPYGGAMGRRRGRCRARWQTMAYGLEDPMPPSTELDKLQAEAEYLTKTLDRLNTRIEELRSKKPDRR